MSSPFWSFDPFSGSISLLFLLSLLIYPLFSSFNKSSENEALGMLQGGVLALFPKSDFYQMGLTYLLSVVFLVMSTINFLSLFPYIYSPLAMISITFSLGFLFWASTFVFQIFYFLEEKIVHLVPQGTPLWLLVFMVVIELVSQFIRPITLSVRLSANLTAGHLILSLLASGGNVSSFFGQLPLYLLELLVCVVQPFVFVLLIFLYWQES